MVLLSIGAKGESESIQDKIKKQSEIQGIPYEIALAVAKTESSLNPKAKGKAGEIGIFQIRPKCQSQCKMLYNIDYNIWYGIRMLAIYKKQCSRLGEAWFICFNQGPNRTPKYPTLFPYYKRVMKNRG